MCEHMTVLRNMWALQQGVKVLNLNVSDRMHVCLSAGAVHTCVLWWNPLHKQDMQQWLAGGGVQSLWVLSPLGDPPPPCSTLDIPDMEHSSQTGDPTWRRASSMPITNWWDLLQPQETERPGMWEKKIVPKIMQEQLKSSICLQQI